MRKERTHGDRCSGNCIGGHWGVLRSFSSTQKNGDENARVAENAKGVMNKKVGWTLEVGSWSRDCCLLV